MYIESRVRPDQESDRNRTGFESFWPKPDTKPEKFDRTRPDLKNFNTQLTSHKRKLGSFVI